MFHNRLPSCLFLRQKSIPYLDKHTSSLGRKTANNATKLLKNETGYEFVAGVCHKAELCLFTIMGKIIHLNNPTRVFSMGPVINIIAIRRGIF